jgi:hypothetical protein
MAKRRRKSKNPETAWLKYALIAGAGYLAYRVLKSKGMLGENGDDEYAPYTPGPVVQQVEETLRKIPAKTFQTAPRAIVDLSRKKKLFDITLEQYRKAPAATAQAQAQYDSAKTSMDSAKARSLALFNEAKSKALSGDRTLQLQAEPLRKAAQQQKDLASSYALKLPSLQDEIRTKKGLEKLPAKQLRKLEGELTEAAKAREVNDFLKAAELVVGAGTVATE